MRIHLVACPPRQALLGVALGLAFLPAHAAAEHYDGFCEASAAAALDTRYFAVAEDESNVLLIYGLGTSKPARPPIPLSDFLGTGDKAADLEAAARIGEMVYWSSSHSLTSKGKAREWRRRLFATQLDSTVSPPTLKPFGKPYVDLLDDLISAPALKSLPLRKAAGIAPEAPDGLNIEGLAATPEGSLLLGFRNPLVEGKALLVPIRNPGPVVSGNQKPDFGVPILLDLGKRGIRSIDRGGGAYWIVAGPVADAGSFALYKWSGVATDAPALTGVAFPPRFSPEALVVMPDTDFALALSDDGARCDPRLPSFQAIRVPLK